MNETSKKGPLTVGDLYCGAGGFSEGFRQAGFKIEWAVDNWRPAVETFRKNFPGTNVIQGDILEKKEVDPKSLEKVDILIGGPPCTHFSLANKGGNGDLKLGLSLVARFIDAVEVLNPRYWIMENVPNLKAILERHEDQKAFSKKRLEKFFEKAPVLRAEEYGVPQSRQRMFAGKFPEPLRMGDDPIPMSNIVVGLPNPLADGQNLPGEVVDPLYNSISLPTSRLTDHFYDTTLSREQVKMARRWKEHHPWYGKMSFPDSLKRPSRTIAATATKSSRASIVILDKRMGRKYRVPTLRECASLQGFPITYQFWASGPSDKQRLIGNSVPPPLARSLALAIARAEGMPPLQSPDFPLRESPTNSAPTRQRKTYVHPIRRPYEFSVEGTLPYCRVGLDNGGRHPAYPLGRGVHHLVGWRTVLFLGYAKDYAAFRVDLKTALEIVKKIEGAIGEQLAKRAAKTAISELIGVIPDATSLQASWAGKTDLDENPDWILQKVAEIAEEVTGGPDRSREGVKASELARLLKGRRIAHGDEIDERRWHNKNVDAYTACSLLSLCVAVKLANEGTQWLRRNWRNRYVANPAMDSLQHPDDSSRSEDESSLQSLARID
ncbi:MAG: DNA cytosine methyltransferase [Nitrososphaerota archaeon]|nr:DNA cytosine methyltransferase [Nitrososphaerota archaeon]